MSRYLRAGLITALIAGVCWCGRAPLRADPRWTDRLHAETIPAWDAEHAKSVAIHGTSRRIIKFKTADGGETFHKYVITRKANHEAEYIILTTENKNVTELYGYNPRYTFRLRSTGDNRWALVSIHMGDREKDGTQGMIRKNIETYSAHFDFGNHIPHDLALFTTHLRRPTSRITSVAPVIWKGVEVMEIKVTLQPANKADELRSITRLQDPTRNWRTVRTVVTGVQKETILEGVTDYEYAPDPDGFLIRAVDVCNYKEPDGKIWPVEQVRTFDLKRVTSLPDTSEFTLSALGLPEPEGVAWQRPRSKWWVLAIAVGVFALLCVVFAWLKRRTDRKSDLPPAPAPG